MYDTPLEHRSTLTRLFEWLVPARTQYHAQQLDLVYHHLPLSQTVSLIIAAILVISLHGVVPQPGLFLWSAMLVAAAFARILLGHWYFHRDPSGHGVRFWTAWFVLTTLVSGVVWGSSALLLFADDIVHQTLLAFVLGGIALGSVFTLSALLPAVASFLLPVLLPIVLRFAVEGESVRYAMAAMTLLFTIAMMVGARAAHAIILNSLRLRDENAAQGTELIRQQKALSERASRLQAILDNTVDSIIAVNDRGYIEGFNRAAEHAFGYGAEQVMNKPLAVLLPPQSGSAWRESWDRCLDTCRKPGAFCELSLMRQDGSIFPVELTLSCVQRAEGSVYVGIFRDISERKRMERLKNEFISTVSHELRTPLTSIRGSLGLISGGAAGELPERAASLVDIAAKNSERLARLIDDILDIERLEAGAMRFDFVAQDLMPLVAEAVASNAGYGEVYDVSLDVVGTAGEATVIMDADRIGQVLANLLSNAIKFSPPGGKVEISVDRRGDAVRVSVTDHGPGIPVGFRPRVFQKFAQADASDERANTGTGLGLSISRAIVEQHGGRMGFTTQLDVGTTFWFELGTEPVEGHESPPLRGRDSGALGSA